MIGRSSVRLSLVPRTIALILTVIALGLSGAGLTVQALRYYGGFDYQLGLFGLFNLESDTSIPTWYATITLLVCSTLIGSIGIMKAERKDRFALHWIVLAVLFLLLSVDEVARIHETIGMTVRLKLTGPLSGGLRHAWVLPGMLFITVVGLLYLRFLSHLPRYIRFLFLLAGLIFVGGALGVEMINAYQRDQPGTTGFGYHAGSVVEETMEMLGIVVFLYALTRYLLEEMQVGALTLGPDPTLDRVHGSEASVEDQAAGTRR